jgi:hypothetical protein
MSAFPRINPVTQLDGKGLVNPDSSGVASFLTTSQTIPSGPHTLPPASSNVQSALGIYQQGGKRKINRKKINKISRKYKMKGSRKHVRRLKSRVRSKYARRSSRRNQSLKRGMRGGMATPVYTAGHSQYMNNNGSIPNTYSLGGPLSAGSSALANPPTFSKVENAAVPDNLNRNALNSYGNRVGAGFASRGWF